MTSRIDVQTTATPASPPVGATDTGRLMLVGRTERGPLTPTLLAGWADYVAKFGARTTDSADTADAVRQFFDERGAQLYMLRAAGPDAVKASRSMSTGGLVVTAAGVGAYGNAITCQFTAATKTLVIVADGVTETYSGTDAASLVAAAASSKTVTVTSNGTLPTGDQASANLTAGDDDYDAVVEADVLTVLVPDLGPGMVAWAGKSYTDAGEALADHAAATDRLALLTCAADADKDAALTAASVVAAYDGASNCVLAWPFLTRVDGVTVSPVGFAGACRSRSHVVSAGQPPWGGRFGRSVTGLVPVTSVTDADFAALDAARVSIIATVYAATMLYGWHLAAPISGNANLDEGSQRDTLNAIAHACTKLTVNWNGSLANRGDLTTWMGALTGVLAGFAAAGALTPPDPSMVPAGVTPDPGYVIDVGPSVNSAASLAAGRSTAAIQARCTGSQEFSTILIAASDQAAASF